MPSRAQVLTPLSSPHNVLLSPAIALDALAFLHPLNALGIHLPQGLSTHSSLSPKCRSLNRHTVPSHYAPPHPKSLLKCQLRGFPGLFQLVNPPTLTSLGSGMLKPIQHAGYPGFLSDSSSTQMSPPFKQIMRCFVPRMGQRYLLVSDPSLVVLRPGLLTALAFFTLLCPQRLPLFCTPSPAEPSR